MQALLRQLPVHPGPERVGHRLPPPDAAGRGHAPRRARGGATPPADDNVMGRTDLRRQRSAPAWRRWPTPPPPSPGSLVRKVMEKATGVSSVRLLPPFARQRFTTWFNKRPRVRIDQPPGPGRGLPHLPGRVPEPGDRPGPGQGLRAQRHRVHAGRRRVLLRRAVAAQRRRRPLHEGRGQEREGPGQSIRAGNDIVVPQPTCSYVLQKDYLDYVGGPDAELVAEHTYDACRVPDAGPQGRADEARPRLPRRRARRRSPTTRPATCGPRTSASRAGTS